jgi:hypothetical protein
MVAGRLYPSVGALQCGIFADQAALLSFRLHAERKVLRACHGTLGGGLIGAPGRHQKSSQGRGAGGFYRAQGGDSRARRGRAPMLRLVREKIGPVAGFNVAITGAGCPRGKVYAA